MSPRCGLAVTHHSDSHLAQRVAGGDANAFADLDARHRNALTRYAGSVLRRSVHDAEDVVQDVLIRAHDALRAGNGPDELRPWLYRLTRNRAIDELRRKRWGDESLDDSMLAGDRRDDPPSILARKQCMHDLTEALAGLPARQREALLALELDGCSPQQVATQLGVSVMAAQKLVMRARTNLVKMRDARDTDCRLIGPLLLDAHERGVRPTEHALRHTKRCDACRAYQSDIRRVAC